MTDFNQSINQPNKPDNNTEEEMYITKRSGKLEIVSFDKILRRIKSVGLEVDIKINYTSLAMKVIDQLYNTISTTKIDELTAEQCASMASILPEYNLLAGRIIISNSHKNTSKSFVEVVSQLYNNYTTKPSIKTNAVETIHNPLVSPELYAIVQKYSSEFETLCDYKNDYLIDYFGFKTLERSYLIRINNKVIERPQHMWLRVSIGIHGDNLPKIIETYRYMSQKYFTHATPTLFNAGTIHPQLSSCYLLAMESDSIDGIYNTLKECALISKWAGGIGLHIHNVRASGSHINGTNGSSNGIVPMLRVFNNTAKYVDQCIHPQTTIYTKTGPIPIAECITGITEIINTTGNYEIVQNVLEHSYEGEMVVISIFDNEMGIEPLLITPEHPVYCVSGYADQPDTVIQNDLLRKIARLEWKDAGKITDDDLIAYSIPSVELIQDYPELTTEICYIYGIMLAGFILPHKMTDIVETNISYDPNRFYINHSTEQIQTITKFLSKYHIPFDILENPVYDTFIKIPKSNHSATNTKFNLYPSDEPYNKTSIKSHTDYLSLSDHFTTLSDYNSSQFIMNTCFGLNESLISPSVNVSPIISALQITNTNIEQHKLPSTPTTPSRPLDNKRMTISWKKTVNIPFRTSDFINPHDNTKINIGQRWLNLPYSKITAFQSGIGLYINNPNIIHEIFFMNLRLGHIYNSYDTNSRVISVRYENYLLVPVKSVKTTNYSGTVYDLQMKHIHNYMLEYGLVHNGGGKRNGSFAIYLETWHADIELFIQLRKNHGEEELRARDLFYALWVCDLFMERIKADSDWTLMCPMNARVWRMYMATISKHYMKNTRPKAEVAKQSKRVIYGFKYWMPKWKPERLIWFIRMPRIANPTNKMWEQLNRPIFVSVPKRSF
jgi:intein/homing endonuclease